MNISPTGRDDAAANEAADGAPLAANLVGGAEVGVRGAAASNRAGGGYSRFVMSMKVLLPFLAISLIALIIIWPRLHTDDTFRIGFSSVSLSDGSQPGMDNARYAGTDKNRLPYSVTADLARMLEGENGDTVSLELPKADMTLENGTWLVLTADTGRYLRDTAILDLQGGVNLFHDAGYEISTQKLLVDLKAGSAEGFTPVSGHGPFGELKAQGIKLVDKGQVIVFAGPAQLILYAPQGEQ